MRAQPHTTHHDCCERENGDLNRFGETALGAHSVATLVMMMSVAICMTPVMPAV